MIPHGTISNKGRPAAHGTSGNCPTAKLDSDISIPVFDHVSPDGSLIDVVNVPFVVTLPSLAVSGVGELGEPSGNVYTLTNCPSLSPDHDHVAVPVVELEAVMVIVPSLVLDADAAIAKLPIPSTAAPARPTIPERRHIKDAINSSFLSFVPTEALLHHDLIHR